MTRYNYSSLRERYNEELLCFAIDCDRLCIKNVLSHLHELPLLVAEDETRDDTDDGDQGNDDDAGK